MVDVVHHHRLEIGVEQGGGEARPFADARQHLARQRHVHAGAFLRNDRARLVLVARIHEGEEVADRDRFDRRGFQLARGLPHRLGVERHQHVAQIVRALGNLPGAALRRDRRRPFEVIVEQVAVARLVLDFLHRAIALGDQQPHLGAAHLQQRVGGDGGAVREEADVAGRDAARDEARHAVEHAERGIPGRARNLLDQQVAVSGVEQHQVGVRAADVDAEPVTGGGHGWRNSSGVMPAKAGIQ